jgi:hypothetical protein
VSLPAGHIHQTGLPRAPDRVKGMFVAAPQIELNSTGRQTATPLNLTVFKATNWRDLHVSAFGKMIGNQERHEP